MQYLRSPLFLHRRCTNHQSPSSASLFLSSPVAPFDCTRTSPIPPPPPMARLMPSFAAAVPPSKIPAVRDCPTPSYMPKPLITTKYYLFLQRAPCFSLSLRHLRRRHRPGKVPHVRNYELGRGQVLGRQRRRAAGHRQHDGCDESCRCGG